MNCSNCGAALPAKSNLCTYCGTLNDTDLRALRREASGGPASDRPCPQCDVPLQTVGLDLGGGQQIERCTECLGIFFDPGELETLLDASTGRLTEIDLERIDVLLREEAPEPGPVRYLPCPLCRKLMHRKGYGARSAIVVDRCRDHGVWLDGGELAQLVKWARAGGRIHSEEREDEAERTEARTRELRHLRPLDGWIDSTTATATDRTHLVDALDVVMRLLR